MLYNNNKYTVKMISTFNLKKLLTSFILSRGLLETEEGFSWENQLIINKKDNNFKNNYQKILLFFKLRGYSFNPDSAEKYLINGPNLTSLKLRINNY